VPYHHAHVIHPVTVANTAYVDQSIIVVFHAPVLLIAHLPFQYAIQDGQDHTGVVVIIALVVAFIKVAVSTTLLATHRTHHAYSIPTGLSTLFITLVTANVVSSIILMLLFVKQPTANFHHPYQIHRGYVSTVIVVTTANVVLLITVTVLPVVFQLFATIK